MGASPSYRPAYSIGPPSLYDNPWTPELHGVRASLQKVLLRIQSERFKSCYLVFSQYYIHFPKDCPPPLLPHLPAFCLASTRQYHPCMPQTKLCPACCPYSHLLPIKDIKINSHQHHHHCNHGQRKKVRRSQFLRDEHLWKRKHRWPGSSSSLPQGNETISLETITSICICHDLNPHVLSGRP